MSESAARGAMRAVALDSCGCLVADRLGVVVQSSRAIRAEKPATFTSWKLRCFTRVLSGSAGHDTRIMPRQKSKKENVPNDFETVTATIQYWQVLFFVTLLAYFQTNSLRL